MFAGWRFPILQKNQFAALARFVLVMCGAESCSCYGVLPGFYFCSANNKALAVPAFEIPLKSVACDYWWGWWAGREEGSVTVRPVKVLPGVGRR